MNMDLRSTSALILTYLAKRAHAPANEIGLACQMKPGEVRARLVHMESLRLVTSHSTRGTVPPTRVYALTAEGRRRVEG